MVPWSVTNLSLLPSKGKFHCLLCGYFPIRFKKYIHEDYLDYHHNLDYSSSVLLFDFLLIFVIEASSSLQIGLIVFFVSEVYLKNKGWLLDHVMFLIILFVLVEVPYEQRNFL